MRPLKFPALVLLPAVAAALPAAAVDFEKEILPIQESKCVKCHHAPYEEGGRTIKPKAGLRMDAAWAIQAGGDGGLRHLLSLGELRHLNLFGSRVSGKGIEKLKNLEAVYLWQTKVTPAGARKLQEALPNARVNFR